MKKIDSSNIERYLVDVVGTLKKEYGIDVQFVCDRDLPLMGSYTKGMVVYLGFEDLNLERYMNGYREYSLDEICLITEVVLHEFFHKFQLEILDKELNDHLKVLDLLANGMAYEYYLKNHDLSLVEISVEKRAWEKTGSIVSQLLNIDAKDVGRSCCKFFFSDKNEFYKKLEPKMLRKVFDKFSKTSIEDILDCLDELEEVARKTKREVPRDLVEDILSREQIKELESMEDPMMQEAQLLFWLLTSEKKEDPRVQIALGTLIKLANVKPQVVNVLSNINKELEIYKERTRTEEPEFEKR